MADPHRMGVRGTGHRAFWTSPSKIRQLTRPRLQVESVISENRVEMWSIASSSSSQAALRGLHRAFPRSSRVLPRVLPSSPPTTAMALARQHKRFVNMPKGGDMAAKVTESMRANPVAWWLFGSAGLIATTMTVGAAGPLTRTGASMLYWVPKEHFPPRSEEDWRHEFDLYRDFAQRHQRIPMTYEDFKRRFKYEYAHRLIGEGTTLAFLGPLAYFYVKERLPTSIHAYLAGVLALGATQMYIGRRMVQNQVVERHGRDPNKEPNFVAPHGLTYDNAFSMANLALLVWAGLQVVSPSGRAVKLREMTMVHSLKDIGELRRYFQYATALFLGTAGAGTLVAGIDAGKEYNTFPKMGKKWIPDGLFERSPWLHNFYENVALVQFDHRLLAVGTLGAYSLIYMKARKPHLWDALPPETKQALNWTMIAVGGQVLGGITMIVNAVPTSLAMLHTSGAAAILGTSLWTLHTLRFARPGGVVKAAAKVAAKAL